MHSSTSVDRGSFRWSDTLITVLAGTVGAVFLSAIPLVLIYGTDVEAWDPAAGFWIILPIQMISQMGMIVLISRWRGTGSLERDFGLAVEPRDAVWIIGGPVALLGLGLVGTVVRAAMGVEDENPQALLDTVSEFKGTITVAAIVIGVVVLGPVVEEVTFRGLLLQTAITKGLGQWPATVISAAAFSLIHLVDWSLASKAGSVTLLVLFLFGIVLARVRLRTGTLGAAIFMHSGFNLTTLVALFFFSDAGV